MNVKIGKKTIGEDQPVYVIAEIGTNHGGSFEIAKKMVEEAAKAGSDAVKFQLFSAEKLVAEKAETFSNEKGQSQLDLYKKLELSNEEYKKLKELADSLGVEFLASAWDEENADFLESIDVNTYKIGSGDMTYVQLVQYIAKKNKPIIVATGLSNLEEVEEFVKTAEDAGNNQLILLHCVANYPSKVEDSNLKAIELMKEKFTYPIGISDHTKGINVSIAAVALGACLVEKHFTLDKMQKEGFGENHDMSIDPIDLKNLVIACKEVKTALGKREKGPTESEKEVKNQIRRGLTAKEDIEKGSTITSEKVIILRPCTGLAPKRLDSIIGKKSANEIKKGSPITENDIA